VEKNGPGDERSPELLVQHGLLDEAEPGATELLGDRDARPAELGELRPGRGGRRLEERACLRAQLVLLGGERGVHA
jgi:hypothetical protein